VDEAELVAVYDRHGYEIEQIADRKYRAGQIEISGLVLVKIEDLNPGG
jgi:23S rRNA C2498 (ribose-2'-O)-methylase RlmM